MILHAQMLQRWAACPLVLGLGLFLLPPPIQAQDTKAIDPFVQATPAQKDSVDQQIEILKKAIMILEQQKAADKAKAAPKQPNEAEVRKAKEDVAAIAKELEVKRGEVKALEQKHAIAMQRLVELTGGKVELSDRVSRWRLSNTPADPAGAKVLGEWMIRNKDAKASKVLLQEVIKKHAPDAAKKPESLEQKLDQLMKEIEDLRREIRHQKGQKPQGASAPATSPPANLTAPATIEKPTIITVPATTDKPTIITVPATIEKPTIIAVPAATDKPTIITVPDPEKPTKK